MAPSRRRSPPPQQAEQRRLNVPRPGVHGRRDRTCRVAYRAADGVAEVADGVRWLDAHVLHGREAEEVQSGVQVIVQAAAAPGASTALGILFTLPQGPATWLERAYLLRALASSR